MIRLYGLRIPAQPSRWKSGKRSLTVAAPIGMRVAPAQSHPRHVSGTGVGDVLRAAFLNEFEILDEPRRQRPILAVVSLAVRPGAGRVEDLLRNAFEFHGDLETEDRVGPVFHRLQLCRERGIQQGARVAYADALADAERPARPPGVDQPAGDVVLQKARLEHLPVGVGLAHHERTAEARAEGDLRFRAQADLGAPHLAGVADRKSTRLNS